MSPARLGLPRRRASAGARRPYARLHYGIGLHAAARTAEAAALFAVLPRPAPGRSRAGAQPRRGAADAARHAGRAGSGDAGGGAGARIAAGAVHARPGATRRPAAGRGGAHRSAPPRSARPASPTRWVNLGLAQYAMGDPADRRTGDAACAGRGTRPSPRRPPISPCSCACAAAATQAQAMLRDLLQRHPDTVEARLNLAAWLLHDEKAPEALALLVGAAAARAEGAPALGRAPRAGADPARPAQRRRARCSMRRAPPGGADAAYCCGARAAGARRTRRAGGTGRRRMEKRARRAPASCSSIGSWRTSTSPSSGRACPADRAFPFWRRGHALLGALPALLARRRRGVRRRQHRPLRSPRDCMQGRVRATTIRRRCSSSGCRAPAPR